MPLPALLLREKRLVNGDRFSVELSKISRNGDFEDEKFFAPGGLPGAPPEFYKTPAKQGDHPA
jgi:hypothetical protein